MNYIGVIDYEAGNTLSVIKALEYLDAKVVLSNSKEELLNCDRIIFPGVGAYYDAMTKLNSYGLVPVIKELAGNGKPFLGICLGMQMLFDESAETIGCEDAGVKSVKGLGILPGTIQKFDKSLCDGLSLKIPQIGWNSINIRHKDSRLFYGIDDGAYVYFVHSYYLKCARGEDVAAVTSYGSDFDSAIEHENVCGCQFHPEKSGDVGLKILKNFMSI